LVALLLERGAEADHCNRLHQSPMDVAADDNIRRMISDSLRRTVKHCAAREERVIAKFSPIQSFWSKTERSCCNDANDNDVKQKDSLEACISRDEKETGKKVERKHC
jgi:hypothetical protein